MRGLYRKTIDDFNKMEIGASLGIQKLTHCSHVEVVPEWSCCSRLYSVSSPEGLICSSEGTYHFSMVDSTQALVMDLKYNRHWFQTSDMSVQMVNSLPLKIERKQGFTSSLLVIDEREQARLKIKRPAFSLTMPVLGVDDIEVGKLKHDWGGDWAVTFPQDLEARFKAALIAACICIDLMSADARRR